MTKQQKENERKQGEMLDYQLAQSKKPQAMPHIPVPPPTPPSAPPPSQTSADVTNAEQNARKQAGKRKGVQSTLLAGNTGGYQPLGGGQTLLG